MDQKQEAPTDEALRARLAEINAKLPAMERERDTLGGESWEGRQAELDAFLARADGQITAARREAGTIMRELARRQEGA